MTQQTVKIPEGASLQKAGQNILITLPGATVPYLYVEGNKVRTAITRHPIDAGLASAALEYVSRYQQ